MVILVELKCRIGQFMQLVEVVKGLDCATLQNLTVLGVLAYTDFLSEM